MKKIILSSTGLGLADTEEIKLIKKQSYGTNRSSKGFLSGVAEGFPQILSSLF